MDWITPGIAAILLLVGALSLIKGSIGQSIRGFLGMIPFGSGKLWGVVLVAVGLIFGGIAGITSYAHSFSPATLVGQSEEPGTVSMLDKCYYATYSQTAGTNVTFRADPNDLSHLYADVKYESGTASLNGTLSCTRSGDIEKALSTECYVKSGTFRNELSTTDSNTYYILATSNKASKVAGVPWAQTAYLSDGSVATTASDQELTQLVFTGGSSAQAKEALGFYMTLPGATVFGYLNNQTSNDVGIICGGSQVARLTVTHTAA